MRRPFLPIAFFVLLCAGLAFGAEGDPRCGVLYSRLGSLFASHAYELKVTEPAALRPGAVFHFHSGRRAPAREITLVGKGHDPESEREMLVFVDANDGEVLFFPASEVKLTARDGGTLELPPTVIPRKQVGGTCASHQLANCVSLLKDAGLEVHGAGGAADLEALTEAISPHLSDKSSAPDLKAQQRNLATLLDRLGVRHRDLTGTDPSFRENVLEHLRGGQPVLLGYRTGGSAKVVRPQRGMAGPEVFSYSAPQGGANKGHAVLALATAKDKTGREKLVVADSGPGKIFLWDAQDLDQFGKGSANRAHLVSLARRETAAPKPVEFEAAFSPASLRQSPLKETGGKRGLQVGDQARIHYSDKLGAERSFEGLVMEWDHVKARLFDPQTGETKEFWMPGFSLNGSGWILEAESRRPVGRSWKEVNNLHQVDRLFMSPETHHYGIFGLTVNSAGPREESMDWIYGQVARRELIPGYPVYEITEADGTRHLLDPNFHGFQVINSAYVTEGGAELAGYFPGLRAKKPHAFLNEGMLLAQAIRAGIVDIATMPLPSLVRFRDLSKSQTEKIMQRFAARKLPVDLDVGGRTHKNVLVEMEGAQGVRIVDPASGKVLSREYTVYIESVHVPGTDRESAAVGGIPLPDYLQKASEGRISPWSFQLRKGPVRLGPASEEEGSP